MLPNIFLKSFSIIKSVDRAINPTLELMSELYLGSTFIEFILKKEIYHKVLHNH